MANTLLNLSWCRKELEVVINTKDKKNLYKNLKDRDIISKLKPLLNAGQLIVHPSGRLGYKYTSVVYDGPWIHSWSEPLSECALWHRIIFKYYKFMPSHCANCWKVVVNCPTLHSLMQLYELQQEMGHPCKCGSELRYTDRKHFGGYFYNRGKQAGEECYTRVRKAVDSAIGEDIDVILKNGCTEMELAHGPFEEWDFTDEQLELEHYIRQWVIIPNDVFQQSEPVKIHVMRSWIHHAYHIGDVTVDMYVDEPMFKDIRTYHQKIGGKENG